MNTPPSPHDTSGRSPSVARRIDVIIALWGETYAEYFLRFCLRTLLAPGNLPALASRFDCVCRIHLDDTAYKRIDNAPQMSALRDICQVEVQLHHVARTPDVYAAVNPLHEAALARAEARDAELVFLTPDMILADGSLARLVTMIDEGARVVYVCPPRLDRDQLVERLPSAPADSSPLLIPPRDMVRLGMNCLHRISDLCFWGRSEITTWPHHLFFEAPEEGMVARGFHLHPLYVAPESRISLLGSTFDTWLPIAACSNLNAVRIVADSDHMAIFEFSAPDKTTGETAPFFFWKRCTARFIECAAAAAHLWIGETPIYIHHSDIGPASAKAVSRSEAVYRKIRRRALLNAFALFLHDPIAVYERARRRNVPGVPAITVPSRKEVAFLRAVEDLVGQLVAERRLQIKQGRPSDKWRVIRFCLRRAKFWKSGFQVGRRFTSGIPMILRDAMVAHDQRADLAGPP